MPYIRAVGRGIIEQAVNVLNRRVFTVGELNFAITKLCLAYLGWIQRQRGTTGYAAYNEVIGVLECAKLELYRRMVAPYEDEKCRENGDVY